MPYEERRHVGTWMVPSYDPELNLIYIGTSVTSPAPKYLLGGNDIKHLYHNCTLAIDADTGKIVWYYQHVVDHWDLDHPFERLLVDTAVAPNASDVRWINPRIRSGRAAQGHHGHSGQDRRRCTRSTVQTGEFLWATPTVHQTMSAGIDGATGKSTVNPRHAVHQSWADRARLPDANGGKNWEASAYSPLTNTMYLPLQQHLRRGTQRPISTRPRSLAVRHFKKAQAAPNSAATSARCYAISAETGVTALEVRAAGRHDVRSSRRAAACSSAAT